MKPIRWVVTVILSLCAGSLATGFLYAQQEDAIKKDAGKKDAQQEEAVQKEKEQDRISPAKIKASRRLSDSDAMDRISTSIRKNKGAKALGSKLVELGFKAERTKVFGQSADLEHENKTMTVELVLQDYSKPGSKDIAALGMARVKSPEGEEQYSFYLVAPNGDIGRAREYTVDKTARVLETHSWWTCLQSKFREVGGACASAAGDCWMAGKCKDKGWTCWLTCVGVPCGWAFVKATACCTCNCKLWCKRFCGCCKQ